MAVNSPKTLENLSLNEQVYNVEAVDAKLGGKQDCIAATGASNLLTAPDSPGGQPGTSAVSSFATAAQGAKADTALQSVTGSNGITVDAKSGTVQNVKGVNATTSATGVVQLSNSTNSTSSTLAATPAAVKAAYDLADAKQPKATANYQVGNASGGWTAASGAVSTVLINDLTADRALISNGSGKISTSSVTSTALAYLDATGSVQAQLTGKLNLAGGAMTGALTLNADPTNNLHAATKQYVDGLIQGLDIKASVRVATTVNLSSLSGLLTVDGIGLSAGNRVLVKNQSAAANNGIYVVAANAWTRAPDFNSAANVTAGAFTFVEEGTANADTGWVLVTDNNITLGTTALTFTQFCSAGLTTVVNGAGITVVRTGNQFTVSHTAHTGDVTGSEELTIGSGKVTSVKIADSAVTTAKLDTGAVTTVKLPDSTSAANGVTYAKMQRAGSLSVLGNTSSTTAAISEISATASDNYVLRRSGTSLAFGQIATGGITDGAITNVKLNADVKQNLFPAGTTGNIYTYSGTSGSLGTPLNPAILYGTSPTAAAAAAKVVTLSSVPTGYTLVKGAVIGVTFTVANTATSNITLAVSGATATAVQYKGSALSTANAAYLLPANRLLFFQYDGTAWQLLENAPLGSTATLTGAFTSTNSNTPNRTYPVRANSDGQLGVDVPWAAANDATITIQGSGTTVREFGSFNVNASSAGTITIPVAANSTTGQGLVPAPATAGTNSSGFRVLAQNNSGAPAWSSITAANVSGTGFVRDLITTYANATSNWNAIMESGVYLMSGTTTAASNAPFIGGGGYWNLLVSAPNSTNVLQIASSGDKVYQRGYNGSSWSPWAQTSGRTKLVIGSSAGGNGDDIAGTVFIGASSDVGSSYASPLSLRAYRSNVDATIEAHGKHLSLVAGMYSPNADKYIYFCSDRIYFGRSVGGYYDNSSSCMTAMNFGNSSYPTPNSVYTDDLFLNRSNGGLLSKAAGTQTAVSILANGAIGQVLTIQSGGAPGWSAPTATPSFNGLSTGGVMYAVNGTSITSTVNNASTAGYLMASGTAAPTWQNVTGMRNDLNCVLKSGDTMTGTLTFGSALANITKNTGSLTITNTAANQQIAITAATGGTVSVSPSLNVTGNISLTGNIAKTSGTLEINASSASAQNIQLVAGTAGFIRANRPISCYDVNSATRTAQHDYDSSLYRESGGTRSLRIDRNGIMVCQGGTGDWNTPGIGAWRLIVDGTGTASSLLLEVCTASPGSPNPTWARRARLPYATGSAWITANP